VGNCSIVDESTIEAFFDFFEKMIVGVVEAGQDATNLSVSLQSMINIFLILAIKQLKLNTGDYS